MRLPLRPVAGTSDPDGQFVLHGVPSELSQLTVDAKGYVRHRQVLRVASGVAQSHDVELVRRPRFTFRLVDPLGAPVASRPWCIEVVCLQAAGERWGGERYSSEQGRTSEEGAATLAVGFAGPWRLLALVPEVGWARLDAVAEEGAATDLGELRLRPFVSVSGTVVRADTGAPVPSLLLDVRAEPDPPRFGLRWLRASGHADEGVSGADGRFRLRLPEGRFSLGADGRLWFAQAPADVDVREAATPGEVTVKVLAPARLRVAIRSTAGQPLADEQHVVASALRADAPIPLSVFPSVLKADGDGTVTADVRGSGASRLWLFVPGQGHGILERVALRAGEEASGKVALGRAAVTNDFELDTGTAAASEGLRAELDDSTFATGGRSLRVTAPRDGRKWLLQVTPGPLLADAGWRLSFDYRIPPGTRVAVLGGPGPLYGPMGSLVCGMSPLPLAGPTNQLTEDDQWHHAEVDLAPCRFPRDELLREIPDEGCQVAFGPQEAETPSAEAGGERRFWLDNVRIGPSEK